jgi:HSP20 family protein
MIEEDDKYRLELALPGYAKEQISMNYLKNVLTIKSNLEENRENEKKYITREFGPRNFTKQFLLPRTLDVEKINAEFKDGILLVTIPKKEEAKIKEPIEVQVQ